MKTYELKRKFFRLFPYWVERQYDNIRFFFNPRQRWLTKKIPNSWIDKDTLWEICILEGIKHYVESDYGLGGYSSDWLTDYEFSQNDPEYPIWQKEFDREVKENYDLITKRLPELEKELEIAWSKVPKWDIKKGLPFQTKGTYEEIYGETDRLEGMIIDLKTKIMLWAIINREKIWT